MKERRPLIEGIKPAIDENLEREFVFKSKTDSVAKPPAPKVAEHRDQKTQPPINRVPFTSRVRAEFADALKRESLERQLNKQYPNSLQEIFEEALEPWMREKGYIQ